MLKLKKETILNLDTAAFVLGGAKGGKRGGSEFTGMTTLNRDDSEFTGMTTLNRKNSEFTGMTTL